MPRKRLTAQTIENLPRPSKGQVEYFDRNMPGFGLRVSYSGTRSWVLMTRVGGKLVRLTLGEWPAMSLAEAHDAARKARYEAKAGADPRESKKARKAEADETAKQTFGVIANDFLKKYAKIKLRERTVTEYERALTGERVAAWKSKPVSSITKRHVMEILDTLEAENKHATARLMLAYLSKFFSWCAERDLVKDIPTDRIGLNGTLKARERVLSIAELRHIWAAASKVGGTGGALVQILILCGQRRFETSMMERGDLEGIDGTSPLWSIPRHITKNGRPHAVPLSKAAVAIIDAQPIVQPDLLGEQQKFVFTTNGATPFSGWSKLKIAIDKALRKSLNPDADEKSAPKDDEAALAPWTFHDLRRSLVTNMNERGLAPPHVVETIVNHVSGFRSGVAGTYNRALFLDERRKALDAWARLVTGEGEADNVVELRRGTMNG